MTASSLAMLPAYGRHLRLRASQPQTPRGREPHEIEIFIDRYTGEIPTKMSAMLMASHQRHDRDGDGDATQGCSAPESMALRDQYDFIADKHSMAASATRSRSCSRVGRSCGVKIGMLSARPRPHRRTLDKLEGIPRFNARLFARRVRALHREALCVISTSTRGSRRRTRRLCAARRHRHGRVVAADHGSIMSKKWHGRVGAHPRREDGRARSCTSIRIRKRSPKPHRGAAGSGTKVER